MVMMTSVRTMLATENQKEAEAVLVFLKMLTAEEQRNFLAFLRGATFVKSMERAEIYM